MIQHCSRRVDHEVGRLQVAVQDLQPVDVVAGVCYVQHHGRDRSKVLRSTSGTYPAVKAAPLRSGASIVDMASSPTSNVESKRCASLAKVGVCTLGDNGLLTAHGPDDLLERYALDVGHRKILQVSHLAGRVNGDDMRLVQRGEDGLLAEEPLPLLRREAIATNRLEGNSPSEGLLDRLVDSSHPAAGKLADNPELAQSAADGRMVAVKNRLSCRL